MAMRTMLYIQNTHTHLQKQKQRQSLLGTQHAARSTPRTRPPHHGVRYAQARDGRAAGWRETERRGGLTRGHAHAHELRPPARNHNHPPAAGTRRAGARPRAAPRAAADNRHYHQRARPATMTVPPMPSTTRSMTYTTQTSVQHSLALSNSINNRRFSSRLCSYSWRPISCFLRLQLAACLQSGRHTDLTYSPPSVKLHRSTIARTALRRTRRRLPPNPLPPHILPPHPPSAPPSHLTLPARDARDARSTGCGAHAMTRRWFCKSWIPRTHTSFCARTTAAPTT
jgi:hypothetical protein